MTHNAFSAFSRSLAVKHGQHKRVRLVREQFGLLLDVEEPLIGAFPVRHCANPVVRLDRVAFVVYKHETRLVLVLPDAFLNCVEDTLHLDCVSVDKDFSVAETLQLVEGALDNVCFLVSFLDVFELGKGAIMFFPRGVVLVAQDNRVVVLRPQDIGLLD